MALAWVRPNALSHTRDRVSHSVYKDRVGGRRAMPLGEQGVLGRHREASALVPPVGCAGQKLPGASGSIFHFILVSFFFSSVHWLEPPTQY